jgi:hypothetical protein
VRDPYESFVVTPFWERLFEYRDQLLQPDDLLWPFERWAGLFGPSMAWLGPAFLVGVLVLVLRRHPARRLAWFLVGGIVLRTIILALMHHELRFYASCVPVLLVFALGGIATALPEGAAVRRFGPAVGVAILAVSFLLQWEAADLSPISRSLRDPAFTAALARLKRGTPPGALVATNRNERVAWFADRPSLDMEPWQLPAVEEKGGAFAQAGWDVHFWAAQGMAAPRLGYAQGVPAGNIVREPLSGEDLRFRRILQRVASEPSYRAFVLTNFTVTHCPYKNRLDDLRARYPEPTAELTRGLSEKQIKSDTLLYQFNLGLQKDFPKSRERHGLTDERVRDLARVVEILYISGIAHLDTLFGSVVAAVDDRGLGSRSLIAFTADHGEVLFRENALFPWSHDFQLAPEVLRVPLIVRGAGLAPGHVDWVTRSIDLYPTLAGLAGVPVADHGIDGLDLSAALRGQEPPPELVAFSHIPKVRSDVVQRALREWGLFASLYPSDGIEQIWVSMRKGDRVFKLRRLLGGQFGFEVFDLASDPWERRNLFRAEDPEHAEIAAALVRYKAGLIAAHDGVPAGEGSKSPLRDHELKALRELGYIQ